MFWTNLMIDAEVARAKASLNALKTMDLESAKKEILKIYENNHVNFECFKAWVEHHTSTVKSLTRDFSFLDLLDDESNSFEDEDYVRKNLEITI